MHVISWRWLRQEHDRVRLGLVQQRWCPRRLLWISNKEIRNGARNRGARKSSGAAMTADTIARDAVRRSLAQTLKAIQTWSGLRVRQPDGQLSAAENRLIETSCCLLRRVSRCIQHEPVAPASSCLAVEHALGRLDDST